MKSWKARESGHASSIESHLSPRFLPPAALRCYKTHPPIAIFSQLHPTSHNCYCATHRDHFLIQATSMEEGSRISGSGHRLPSAFASASVPAPFVLKTHRMVDDPSTDGVIAWGRDSNSFVVVDPFAFSQTLLPAHFKHGNFSSFVRQLNTYGFRKVDPDRWEFAHASFLRGQTHLLKQIVRKSGGCGKKKEDVESEEEEERVAAEVVRLKHEQRRIKERLEGMWKRVKETERRPRQMLAFLVKVAGDPDLVDRLGGPAIEGGEKRARRLGTATGNGRRVEMEGGDGYSWDLDGQGMGIVMGEDDDRACGVNIGGTHRGQFRGDVDDVGLFGGVEVEFGAGPAAYPYPCGPCPFHVENGVQ